MAYTYVLLAVAQQELESSVLWYNERSETVTDQFNEAIERTLQLICDNPNRWRKQQGKYRELGMRNFLIV